MLNNIDSKECTKCHRIFPATLDYFYKDKKTKDSLSFQCKGCLGKKSFLKEVVLPKDGYKFCIKCNRELPFTSQFFPVDKSCKNGLRNVCRECGKDGHFMEDNYIPVHKFSDEENNLFINIYPHYLNEEIINLYFPHETLKSLQDKAYRLNLHKTKDTMLRKHKLHSERMAGCNAPNYGKKLSYETRRKISEATIGKYTGENNYWYGRKRSKEQTQQMTQRVKDSGAWIGNNNPRHIHPLKGEENGRWLGGRTQLYFDLRNHLQEWKQKSMEYCNYKCVITNTNFDNIHHLYSFRNIVNEVFINLNIDIKQTIGDYNEKTRQLIYNELIILHNKYGLGVCLKNNIHRLFHNLYGYSNNTPQQFEEFKQRYYNHEFNEIINNNIIDKVI